MEGDEGGCGKVCSQVIDVPTGKGTALQARRSLEPFGNPGMEMGAYHDGLRDWFTKKSEGP